jgi:SRSO17 transposase
MSSSRKGTSTAVGCTQARGTGGCGVRGLPGVSRGVRHRGLHYLVGVQAGHKVWPPGAQPQRPASEPGKKGGPSHALRGERHRPWAIGQLVHEFPKEQWHTVSWREGSKGEQSSRFAAVRVHTAERHVHGVPLSEQVWLLVQWPQGEKAPTKYALSSLLATTPLNLPALRGQAVRPWVAR